MLPSRPGNELVRRASHVAAEVVQLPRRGSSASHAFAELAKLKKK